MHGFEEDAREIGLVRRSTYQCVELAGVEGLLLLGDGLGVELGEGVGCAAEGGVERAVGLVQARSRLRLALSRHRRLAAAAKREPRLGWEAGLGHCVWRGPRSLLGAGTRAVLVH